MRLVASLPCFVFGALAATAGEAPVAHFSNGQAHLVWRGDAGDWCDATASLSPSGCHLWIGEQGRREGKRPSAIFDSAGQLSCGQTGTFCGWQLTCDCQPELRTARESDGGQDLSSLDNWVPGTGESCEGKVLVDAGLPGNWNGFYRRSDGLYSICIRGQGEQQADSGAPSSPPDRPTRK
jgi:hypothetical protein